MASNYAKLWLQKDANRNAIRRAQEQIQSTGSALPCRVVAVSGAIVTVAFEVDSQPWTLPRISIPKAESNWIRMPTQVGDYGITVPVDTYIGNISGMGGGLPKLTVRPFNLSALVFMPVSNKSSPPQDQNAAIVQAPNGAIVQTTGGTTSSIITNTSGTVITYGSATIMINATGITMSAGGQTLSLTSSGIVINGINFGTHQHTGVQPGTGTSGGPV